WQSPSLIAKTENTLPWSEEYLTVEKSDQDDETPHSSVLADGDWFRFAVVESGVYKIDADLLQNAGVDIISIDPRKIGIFGYGGGMLPQSNSAPRPVDLPEMAIYVSGESDGRFDADDFIVFYAEGPD